MVQHMGSTNNYASNARVSFGDGKRRKQDEDGWLGAENNGTLLPGFKSQRWPFLGQNSLASFPYLHFYHKIGEVRGVVGELLLLAGRDGLLLLPFY